MMRSEARVSTSEGERYAGLLCKHAAHMGPKVDWTSPNGTLEFPNEMGTCRLATAADHLLITLECSEAANLARMQQIIADNIERFAFREAVKVEWGPNEPHR